MPGTLDLVVYQGATFDRQFVWKASNDTPYDLTTYTARMQIRPRRSSDTVLLELTTENGRILLGGVDGTIRLLVDAADTAALAFSSGVYDLEVDNGGVVTRLLQGRVTLSKEVTR